MASENEPTPGPGSDEGREHPYAPPASGRRLRGNWSMIAVIVIVAVCFVVVAVALGMQ